MTPDERAKKMETLILNRLTGKQHQIATTLGVSESSVSRLKDGQLSLFCQVLAQAGIKAVPVEMHVYDEDEISAYLTLARKHMEKTNGVDLDETYE